jgi:hypothetical protein
MSLVTEEGHKTVVRGTIETELSKIVKRYIALATSAKDRGRRVKHVLALGGNTVLGLDGDDVRKALSLRNDLARTLNSLTEELAELARETTGDDEVAQTAFEESIFEPLAQGDD